MATKPKRPRDLNQLAHALVGLATGEIDDSNPDEGKNLKKVESGRKGGLLGGRARVAKLTPDELSAAGKKAVSARWKKG